MDALSDHFRTEAREIEPFEKLLRREGDERVGDDAPESVRARELYRPLEEKEQAELVAAIEQALGAPATPVRTSSIVRRPATPDAPAQDENEGARDGKSATLLRFRVVLIPLALAASIALAFTLRGSDDALPRYAIEAHGGESELRGGAAATPTALLRVRAGSPFELVLRPSQTVSGRVKARVFVESADASRRELTALTTDISSEGSIRVRGRLDAVRSGDSLIALVGRPRAVEAGPPAGPGAELLRVALETY